MLVLINLVIIGSSLGVQVFIRGHGSLILLILQVILLIGFLISSTVLEVIFLLLDLVNQGLVVSVISRQIVQIINVIINLLLLVSGVVSDIVSKILGLWGFL